MSELTVRTMRRGDGTALCALWQSVFGDEAALIEEFLRLLPEMGLGFAAECDGNTVGMAYLITGMELAGERAGQIGYLYAVAVDEKHRGRGIGEKLVHAAEAECETRGLLFATEPADERLCGWYEKLCGMKKTLFRRRVSVPARAGELWEISPEEYLRKRETVLCGRDHVKLNAAAMAFEHTLCRSFGGGFFADEGGIAAGYPEGGRLKICELLGAEALAAAMAHRLGCGSAEILAPADCGENFISAKEKISEKTVWNLSFD